VRGAFITLEGGEGAGKTTLARSLASALRFSGLQVDLTREPGGTPDAELVRNLLVTGGTGRWSAMEEACLLFAARLNHVRNRISPAIERGEWVLCDRFTDSSIAYQGYAGDQRTDLIRLKQLAAIVMGDFKPNLTIIVDVDPEIGLRRTVARGEAASRFELLGLEFHRRLRHGYLEIAREEPVRCAVVDGHQEPELVFRQAMTIIQERLGWPRLNSLPPFGH
jgi:dTMP kinase